MIESNTEPHVADASQSTMYCFRAHRPTPLLIENYKRFVSTYGAERVCVLVDQTQTTHDWPGDFNILGLDNEFIDSLRLHRSFGKVGWRCGDYFYYLALQNFEFDFLWLIESDVYFHYDGLNNFFSSFDKNKTDFISHRIRRRESEWHWYRSMADLGYREVYGSLFPLTRVSRSGLQYLLAERQRISAQYVETASPGQLYPNDEAFTASTFLNTQFTMQSLKETHPKAFPFYQYADKYCLPDILEEIDSPSVVHSALEPTQYLEYAQNRFIKKLRSDPSVAKTLRVLYQRTNIDRHPKITAALLEAIEDFIDEVR